jgi:predicted transposase YbfD/YdcC
MSTTTEPSSEQTTPLASIDVYFGELEDPRREGSTDYPLHEIIVLTICAVICGADGFTSIANFGKAKKDWLGQFLDLENGIPSHDTIGRFYRHLDPEGFEECFLRWMQSACRQVEEEVVAIDGKELCGSYDRHSNKAALHMVSAWASENRLSLGQVKTEEKSNEITAIPRLLEALDVSGCVVTIDAMGCQTNIAETIVQEEADYVLALKDNQQGLRASVETIFDRLVESDHEAHSPHKHVTGGHDRVETRRCWATDVDGKGLVDQTEWEKLKSICLVEYEKFEDGETSTERRYFISSLEPNPEKLLEATRRHWHIETKMHWVLDVAFQEDDSRIRMGNAAQNMSAVRRLALGLLEQEESLSVGTKNKRLRAGWDQDYLEKILRQV